MDAFFSAYSLTSQIMFPILVFIIILIIKDLSRYSKLSERIYKILKDICDDIEDAGFIRNTNENDIKYIQRYISSKLKK
tara:strand:- start:1793 stop:2029 length:237 start_codon:yes stop_codon:yes gene_type:complete